MRVSELIAGIDRMVFPPGGSDFEVTGISCDSRQVREGFMFIAVRGARDDGARFIGQALENGASAIVTDRKIAVPATGRGAHALFLEVENCREAASRLAAVFFGHPGERVRSTGITGTNGKTTVSYLIEAVLKEAGRSCAVIGTVNYRVGTTVIPSTNTTPGPVELQELLGRIVAQKVTDVVMEVSSHALDQRRTDGVRFCSAVFTNLTRDHLDYHGSFDSYFRAKERLFNDPGPSSFSILNFDDEYGKRLLGRCAGRVLTYAVKTPGADVSASEIKLSLSGTTFRISWPSGSRTIRTRLMGGHNVYNALAAFSWALGEGIGEDVCVRALEGFAVVPGRLEGVETGKGFSVFVDYAHTDDALRNVISAIRVAGCRRIIVVFGCGGDRDRGKRPKMGGVVSELADYAVITNDNPRSEEPRAIIHEISSGMKSGSYEVVPDRREAIEAALALAREGDVVLVAGKGHEAYQITGASAAHFDDRETVNECLKRLN